MRILGGFFLLYGGVMEKYNKPPLPCDKQVELLISRGLVVSQREKVEKFLSQVNYYRFSAYCLPFEIKRHKFHSDVTFEKTIFQPPPNRFEAGTGNIADAVGLGAAIDYVEHVGLENIESTVKSWK